MTDIDARVESLRCKGLCQECCGPISFPKSIRDKYPELDLPRNPVQVLLRVTMNGPYMCPFLKDGKCQIYDERPAICRLWGASTELRCPHGCTDEMTEEPLSDKEGKRYLKEHGALTW